MILLASICRTKTAYFQGSYPEPRALVIGLNAGEYEQAKNPKSR